MTPDEIQDIDLLLEADFLGREQTLTLESAEQRLRASLERRAEGRQRASGRAINELELQAEFSLWFSALGYRSVAYDAAGLTATLVRTFAGSAHKVVDAHKQLMISMFRGDDEPDIEPLWAVWKDFTTRI